MNIPQVEALEKNGFAHKMLEMADDTEPRLERWSQDYGPLLCFFYKEWYVRPNGERSFTVWCSLGAPSDPKLEYCFSERRSVAAAASIMLEDGDYKSRKYIAEFLEDVKRYWKDYEKKEYTTEQMQEAVDEIFADLKTIQGGLEKLPW